MTNETPTRYRFHAHLWTPQTGHQDKRLVMTGTDADDAYTRLQAAVTRRYGREAIVSARFYETLA